MEATQHIARVVMEEAFPLMLTAAGSRVHLGGRYSIKLTGVACGEWVLSLFPNEAFITAAASQTTDAALCWNVVDVRELASFVRGSALRVALAEGRLAITGTSFAISRLARVFEAMAESSFVLHMQDEQAARKQWVKRLAQPRRVEAASRATVVGARGVGQINSAKAKG